MPRPDPNAQKRQSSNWARSGTPDTYNMADILGSRTRDGTQVGTVTVGTSAVALRVDAFSNLSGRHTLLVINDSLNDIYLGFADTVTVNDGVPVFANMERRIEFDPNEDVTIWAIAEESLTIRVVEVK